MYWSRLGDTTKCSDGAFGFDGCYLQQIQSNNNACGSFMNIDVKRVDEWDEAVVLFLNFEYKMNVWCKVNLYYKFIAKIFTI